MLSSLYALPFYDFDLRASHARTLLPAALASVPFGFVLVRVRLRAVKNAHIRMVHSILLSASCRLLPAALQHVKHELNDVFKPLRKRIGATGQLLLGLQPRAPLFRKFLFLFLYVFLAGAARAASAGEVEGEAGAAPTLRLPP